VKGNRLRTSVDGEVLFDVEDEPLLNGGAVALICEEGCMAGDSIRVQPVGIAV
jgi:hypothetical protein